MAANVTRAFLACLPSMSAMEWESEDLRSFSCLAARARQCGSSQPPSCFVGPAPEKYFGQQHFDADNLFTMTLYLNAIQGVA
jgi:hypothetical protein